MEWHSNAYLLLNIYADRFRFILRNYLPRHLHLQLDLVQPIKRKQNCENNSDDIGNTYVWLDIFSIPQFHNGYKLFAVISLYVYAAAAEGLIIIHAEDLRRVRHLLDSSILRRL